MSNLATVQAIYEAFSRGDFDAVLAYCVESPEWEYGSSSTNVPWLRRQISPEGAVANMRSSIGDIEIQKFVPKAMLEGEGVVAVLLDIEFIVKKTGKRVEEVDAVQLWRFNDAGQVTQFRQRVDTHQQELAYNG
ncbi:MAG: nuclear transport factor 2 family protein [Caldilineaceae bacterium]